MVQNIRVTKERAINWLYKGDGKMKVKNIVNVLFFLVGIAVLSLGIGCIITSQFGTSAWDAVSVALYKDFGLSIGFWLNSVAVVLICIGGLLLKKIPRFSTLITSLVLGAGLDFWLWVLKDINCSIWLSSAGVFLVGILIMGLGIAIYLVSGLPPNPLDYFMLCIHERFNLSIAKARTLSEAIGFLIGFILGGPIGIGTFVILFFAGPIIQFYLKYTTKFYDFIIKRLQSLHH